MRGAGLFSLRRRPWWWPFGKEGVPLDRLTGLRVIRSYGLEFEWDDAKAVANLRDHGVSFAQAAAACADPFAVEWIDDREAYGEERVILLGMKDGQVLVVVYAERNARIRIISARRATKHEQDVYFRQNAP